MYYFIGTLILAFVILFVATKDRWNWKRIIGTLLVTAMLSVLCISVIFIYDEWWIYRPAAAGAIVFEDGATKVKLGDSLSDVVFRNGDPHSKLGDNILVYQYNDEKISDFFYYVKMEQGEVTCVLAPQSAFYFPFKLGGATIDDTTLDSIIDKLGHATFLSESSDYKWRLFSYAKYNISFLLHLNKIEWIAIFDGRRTKGLEFGDEIVQADNLRRARLQADRVAAEMREKQELAEKQQQALKAAAARLEEKRAEEESAAERRRLEEEKEQADRTARRNAEIAKKKAMALRDIGWIQSWGELRIGMTFDQARELLGHPLSLNFQEAVFKDVYEQSTDRIYTPRILLYDGKVSGFEGPPVRGEKAQTKL